MLHHYTHQSDFYAHVDERGANRVSRHIRLQNPALFNFGTSRFTNGAVPFCTPIESAPWVTELATEVRPIKLPDSSDLHYCYQVKLVELDVFPTSQFALPTNLYNGVLPANSFAIKAAFSAGIEKAAGGVTCFDIELYMVLRAIFVAAPDRQLRVELVAIELNDIAPDGLESILEEILVRVLNQAILSVYFSVTDLAFNVADLVDVSFIPTTGFPNPAHEDNCLKVYLNAIVS